VESLELEKEKIETLNIKQRIFDAFEKNHSKRTGTNVHISDLSHCLRQSCFRRLDENQLPMNEQSIKSLLVGTATHRYIQSLLGDEFEIERQIIRKVGGVTIIAHPDIVHTPTNTVIELKTTTSLLIFNAPFTSHLRQLKSYCALLSAQRGILFYVILGKDGMEGQYFKEYHVSIGHTEQRLILDKLDKQASELKHTFELGDPSQAPHIADDPEYLNRFTKTNWMCSGYCQYKEKCDIMRVQEKSTSRGRND
jgi:hypothetical protein